jgi:hypothetical protein
MACLTVTPLLNSPSISAYSFIFLTTANHIIIYYVLYMWVVASATRLGGKLRANPTSAAPGCPPVRL